MAFDKTNLHVAPLTGNNSPTIWDYSTSDTVSDVSTSNYFADSLSTPSFRVGDIVRVTASDGNVIVIVYTMNYTASSLQTVTMADVSSF